MWEEFGSMFRAVLGGMIVIFLTTAGLTAYNLGDKCLNWIECDAVVVDGDVAVETRHGVVMAGKVPVLTTYKTNVLKAYYEYEVDGVAYQGVTSTSSSMSPGTEIVVRYNPKNPGESVMWK